MKFTKLAHKIMYFFTCCVPNMRAVFVNIDIMLVWSINVTSNVISFFYYKNFFVYELGLVRKNTSKKTRANNHIIIHVLLRQGGCSNRNNRIGFQWIPGLFSTASLFINVDFLRRFNLWQIINIWIFH